MLTTNPKFGEIDAVAEPLAILPAVFANSTFCRLVNCEPSPANEPLNEPLNSFALILSAVISPVTLTLPVNSDFTEPVENTLNTPPVETDAVTEPVAIKFEISASSVSAERGISKRLDHYH